MVIVVGMVMLMPATSQAFSTTDLITFTGSITPSFTKVNWLFGEGW
jgi:hypothetical protein